MNPVFAKQRLCQRAGTLLSSRRRLAARAAEGALRSFRASDSGLVLIDTGYGAAVTTQGKRSLGLRLYNAILDPDLVTSGQPAAVLQRLGFTPDDVSVVIVTHFHADHVAGLDAFANALIIARREMLGRVLTAPARANLRHGIFTELLPAGLLSRTVDVDASTLIEAPLGLGKAATFSVTAACLRSTFRACRRPFRFVL